MICPTCGNEFAPKKKNHKYCTELCRPSRSRRPNLILLRDHFRCFYCGKSAFADGVILEVDHIQPASYGGKPTASNLVTACRECNQAKKDAIIVSPLLDELQAEIAQRNAKAGIVSDMEFTMNGWTYPEHWVSSRRKTYLAIIARYKAEPTPEA
jgi:hypothetical protein